MGDAQTESECAESRDEGVAVKKRRAHDSDVRFDGTDGQSRGRVSLRSQDAIKLPKIEW